MKCANCNGEWTPPNKMVITICPFCGSELSKTIFDNSDKLNTDLILSEIINFYGKDLINDHEKLGTIIKSNFANDLKIKNLLLDIFFLSKNYRLFSGSNLKIICSNYL